MCLSALQIYYYPGHRIQAYPHHNVCTFPTPWGRMVLYINKHISITQDHTVRLEVLLDIDEL